MKRSSKIAASVRSNCARVCPDDGWWRIDKGVALACVLGGVSLDAVSRVAAALEAPFVVRAAVLLPVVVRATTQMHW